jgi:outer membrane biosynthesis protein TonB
MIPRTLVPVNVRPVSKDEAKKATPRRFTTYMDDRTVVPSGLSEAPPLNGHSSIPSYLPLGVLVNRTLVPRGLPAKPLEKIEQVSELPLDILDTRVVVPKHVEPLSPEEIKRLEQPIEMTPELREIVEPDVFTTGDTNLLIEPEKKIDPRKNLVTRVLSVAVHVLLIIFLLAAPKMFPAPRTPTQTQLEFARIYAPPDLPKSAPPPAPKIPITRETLKKLSPPVEEPKLPAPEPVKPPSDLPEAPKPQPSVAPPPPPPPQQQTSQLQPIQPVTPKPRLNLGLNQSSPGKELQDQIRDAIRQGQQGAVYSGGQTPTGGGRAGIGSQAQILSDTQGVDFNPYIQRLLATLRRNWMAVMPESAYMGDKGIVFTTFQINPDGSVPSPDPQLERTSGKEPLDTAAMSAIHASNPFEPLPSQFHGPYLRLRIIFIYNIPLDQVNFH